MPNLTAVFGEVLKYMAKVFATAVVVMLHSCCSRRS